MSDSNGTTPYRVTYTSRAMEQLTEYALRAVQLGRRAWFAQALRDIEKRLRTNPREWGDPQ